MALTLDIKDGAELQEGTDGDRIVRVAYASNIPAAAVSDPFLLVNALIQGGLPVLRESHPASSLLRLRRRIVRPAANTNDAVIYLIYEGPNATSGITATWVVEDDTTMAQEVEEIDTLGRPIQAIFKTLMTLGPISSTNPTPHQVAIEPKFTAGVPVLRPRRVISVAGIIRGRPDGVWLDAQDTVNIAEWQGKPRGYWLCTRVRAAVAGLTQTLINEDEDIPHTVRAEFATKVTRDWSSYAIYRTPQGNIPKALCTDEEASARLAVINSEYSQSQNNEANGFVKVGMYGLHDFYATFGF